MKHRKKHRRSLTALGKGLVIGVCAAAVAAGVGLAVRARRSAEAVAGTAEAAGQTSAEQAPAEEPPALLQVATGAKSVYVLDTEKGWALLDENGGELSAPASTTKLLTALTALDICSPNQMVTVGDEVKWVEKDSSRAYLSSGDTLSMKELLTAMLLPSGNDAAMAVAVYSGRCLERNKDLPATQAIAAFVEAMNRKAVALGAADSRFLRPDGYDTDGQTTTAHDLACIGAACLKNETIAAITGSAKKIVTWKNGKQVTYENTNLLLDPQSVYYDQRALGLKTGSSTAAGYCLVSAAKIGEKTVVCVILGDTENGRFTDTKNVFQAIENSEGETLGG